MSLSRAQGYQDSDTCDIHRATSTRYLDGNVTWLSRLFLSFLGSCDSATEKPHPGAASNNLGPFPIHPHLTANDRQSLAVPGRKLSTLNMHSLQ